MTPERWQQVDDIFQAAVELSIEDRAAFVDSATEGDDELRREVESLIAADEQGLNLVEEPAFRVAASLLASSALQLREGQSISHYEIIGPIGRGGMGEVYLARDQLLNRRVALKLLPADYTKHTDRLRRFQQEAQAASALNHPNILTIHELGQVDGQQFIATELVEGETLRQLLQHRPLRLPEILDIANQIAAALAAAHKAGIVHRDIKPENIMLRHDGYVKVLDFGLAKLTEQHEPTTEAQAADNVNISSGLLMGTVKYMSPEQARGQQVDARSDIFSFGVVLYEMIVGRAPFEGKTTKDLITAIQTDEPTPFASMSDELPTIINKTLRKDKQSRYQAVEEVLIDLKRLKEALKPESKLRESQSNVSQPAVVSRGIQSAIPTGKLETTDSASSIEFLIEKIQRHKNIATLAAFAIVLIAVGFGLYRFIRIRRAAITFPNLKVTNLTTSGDALFSAISPDGKYLVFIRRENGLNSMWLRTIAINKEVQILPPEAGVRLPRISPDDRYIYYSLSHPGGRTHDVYQLPLLGGVSTKVLSNVDGNVSISPDGKRLAYCRELPEAAQTVLVTANSDGTDERNLLTRYGAEGIGPEASWSPDGTTIACPLTNSSGKTAIIEVNALDGTERAISAPNWKWVISLAWLPDKSGLILLTMMENNAPQQMWHLSYPTGEAQRLTDDNYYGIVTVGPESQVSAIRQSDIQSTIWTVPVDPNDPLHPDLSRAHQLIANKADSSYATGLPQQGGLAFTPDGQLIYTSKVAEKNALWIMGANGENPKQLADDGFEPAGSPDDKYVVFTSPSKGESQLWRMDIDGRNQRQLTWDRSAYHPSISPDSRWVLYQLSAGPYPTAWKVPIDGGQPIQLTTQQAQGPRFSPDGKLIAYGYWSYKNEPMAAIIRSDGGPPLRTFTLTNGFNSFNWTPDGKALTIGLRNLSAQPITGGPPIWVTNFANDSVPFHAWSQDGTKLAFTRVTQPSDVVLITGVK
jgi:eukaryotic-like serine/threonine-protein kinase